MDYRHCCIYITALLLICISCGYAFFPFKSFTAPRVLHQRCYGDGKKDVMHPNRRYYMVHGKLLPDPAPSSIGNFFENKTQSMSFIQCYMVSIGAIDKDGVMSQYGVGIPVDMPVMLTYFEDNELKPVRADYPDYDHLINHVAVQMDSNEFQLYKTPVVLTLQGEFEDDELDDDADDEGEYDDDGEEEELTLEELLALEDDDVDDDDEDDDGNDDEDDADDENANMSSFWSSSPAGKIDEKYNKMPDFDLVRPEAPDVSDIPNDAFVTPEDSKLLRKAHRRADRIIEYASDMSLIASFHYKKKNFHLVRLLESIFIIGKRIMDIKGYYFTLLDDSESERIRPVLEQLILDRNSVKAAKPESSNSVSRNIRDRSGSDSDDDSGSSTNSNSNSGSSSGKGRPTTRRRWLNTKNKKD